MLTVAFAVAFCALLTVSLATVSVPSPLRVHSYTFSDVGELAPTFFVFLP